MVQSAVDARFGSSPSDGLSGGFNIIPSGFYDML